MFGRLRKKSLLVGGITASFDKSQTRYGVKVRYCELEAMRTVPGALLWKHRHTLCVLREICVSVSQFTTSRVLNDYKSSAPLQATLSEIIETH